MVSSQTEKMRFVKMSFLKMILKCIFHLTSILQNCVHIELSLYQCYSVALVVHFKLTLISLPAFCGTFATSAEPDQTLQSAASDQGLRCLLTKCSIKI